jgi:hypothetical protein
MYGEGGCGEIENKKAKEMVSRAQVNFLLEISFTLGPSASVSPFQPLLLLF